MLARRAGVHRRQRRGADACSRCWLKRARTCRSASAGRASSSTGPRSLLGLRASSSARSASPTSRSRRARSRGRACGPARSARRWRWASSTSAFPLYLTNVSTLRDRHVSAVFVLIALVWFYMLALIVLAGAVVNELRFERFAGPRKRAASPAPSRCHGSVRRSAPTAAAQSAARVGPVAGRAGARRRHRLSRPPAPLRRHRTGGPSTRHEGVDPSRVRRQGRDPAADRELEPDPGSTSLGIDADPPCHPSPLRRGRPRLPARPPPVALAADGENTQLNLSPGGTASPRRAPGQAAASCARSSASRSSSASSTASLGPQAGQGLQGRQPPPARASRRSPRCRSAPNRSLHLVRAGGEIVLLGVGRARRHADPPLQRGGGARARPARRRRARCADAGRSRARRRGLPRRSCAPRRWSSEDRRLQRRPAAAVHRRASRWCRRCCSRSRASRAS